MFKTLDPKALDISSLYKFMIEAIVPRPIAWVSTRGENGVDNLAPFSYFAPISTRPPCIAFSIAVLSRRLPTGDRVTEKKDTLRNILHSREFVAHIADEPLAQAVNQSSADYAAEISEFDRAGVTRLPSTRVTPPRVAEAPIHLECRLHHHFVVGDGVTPGSATLVVGEIVAIHVADRILTGDAIDVAKLRPLSRLGGLSYGLIDRTLEIPRPVILG